MLSSVYNTVIGIMNWFTRLEVSEFILRKSQKKVLQKLSKFLYESENGKDVTQNSRSESKGKSEFDDILKRIMDSGRLKVSEFYVCH
jgi:hypothetical protein